MQRLPPIPEAEMTEAQRRVHDQIASGPRGGVRGPFPAWLRSPELAARAQALGEFLRFGTSLPPHLNELAIIVTARAWTAQYEWYAHARLAREGGLPEVVIEAVANRQPPPATGDAAMDRDIAIVHAFCTELHRDHDVSDATWTAAVERFGEHGAVELIGLSGYYVLVAMTLNATRVPLPEGEPLPLKD